MKYILFHKKGDSSKFQAGQEAFQQSFKGVSGKFQWPFKEVSRVLQDCFKGYPSKFQGPFQQVSKEIQEGFKEVSTVFHERF